MKSNYLMYGLGAAAIFFVLKGKKQEPVILAEDTPAAPRKKKKKQEVVAALDQFTAGKDGEALIKEIMKFEFPAKGVAPRVPVTFVSASGKTMTDKDQLYINLASEMEKVSDAEKIVDLYFYLGQKSPRSNRETVLYRAARLWVKD